MQETKRHGISSLPLDHHATPPSLDITSITRPCFLLHNQINSTPSFLNQRSLFLLLLDLDAITIPTPIKLDPIPPLFITTNKPILIKARHTTASHSPLHHRLELPLDRSSPSLSRSSLITKHSTSSFPNINNVTRLLITIVLSSLESSHHSITPPFHLFRELKFTRPLLSFLSKPLYFAITHRLSISLSLDLLNHHRSSSQTH